jgi:toxin ParE1/3/4
MKTQNVRVEWTRVAAEDLARLAAYLIGESPLRAVAIIDRIVERAESVANMPGRGRLPPELRSVGDRSWREVQDSPWRIIYRHREGVVQIHAVLDCRRSLEDILMERLLKS